MVCLCSWFVWSTILIPAAAAALILFHRRKSRPPGPPGWPIFGNIFDLGSVPHRTLYNLRLKYGPVIWLKLGSMNTMVVQSAAAAAELFKNHDQAFCDRKCFVALTAHNYNQGSLGVCQFGPHWRLLRRLCTMELLGTKRINETAHLRRKCVDNLIRNIEEDAAAARARGETGEVNLAHSLFLMSFNLIGNLVLSRDLFSSSSKGGHDFFVAMNAFMECAVKPNLSDFLPFLKRLDPQGIMKNMEQHLGRAVNMVERFVEERMEEYKSGRENKKQDFLDVLLENGGDGKDKISGHSLVILVLEMFFAGSETTSSVVEWAMTHLLCKPESMKRVKTEVLQVVGPNRKVEEKDMDELPYLQAVIKETLRLHPAIPLLIPRSCREDTSYMGYQIPKDTAVFVNAWAIGRDPDCWEDPLCFKPERFLGSKIDYKGQNFELIPFGSGRRICVGMSLAQQEIQLALASLLHCFDWELGTNLSPESVDMSEWSGLAARKFIPLKLIPKKRIM
ncbi:iridoid oxidase-like [Tripterygium wilfordii]|uniref:iridoid oxidase-like n=1 Tax=Tripterygium wilfordii TaxID=458696 RepID=UPI0018F85704|nr:iridoid oxidase-like [Tripterygium wilfordii]